MQAQRKTEMNAMPAPAQTPEPEARVAPPPFPTIGASGEAPSIPSPAHALQERLQRVRVVARRRRRRAYHPPQLARPPAIRERSRRSL